ncbi:flavodoxin [Methanosarcina sp. 2.H.T.1A.6]|uniref:flavodoxin domain-containing protein n=1 Tax=unclassified Methanosarcina TaxID=2644672 RepID=UPI00062142AB|nr:MULTISPECIES: flavodoxin domain-containing protein [unclassified Methanosarcina]KKG16074.1 flavodoxin [Methanosarcina sp. 2.H.T.1A.3]KKG20917.1 flavodoxin [Methanosarcina sp. 2.H.T.1A.8]KKG24308.1 flavodoxin [Methanosarcina sp. 2.H.T.1A.6]KKG27973.1 flavodoxin [Methanosarcina sp. 2.H.T.1A.15]
MQTKVLVAYASKYGSTQEVAEAIAATLRESDLAVDLEPMKEVKTLNEYTAVVLGAPIYMLHWHKEAKSFLSRHREALTKVPVAIFALGPFHNEEEEWKEVRAQLDEELAKFPWLRPIAIEIFGGKFDPEKLRFPDNLIAKLPASPLRNMPASDARDWVAIRDWASNLATQFQPALAH